LITRENLKTFMPRFGMYLVVMSLAGCAAHQILAHFSPRIPNVETGEVYRVLNRGRGGRGDYFVTSEWAAVLWFFLAHPILVVLLAMGSWAKQIAKSVIADSRYVEERRDV